MKRKQRTRSLLFPQALEQRGIMGLLIVGCALAFIYAPLLDPSRFISGMDFLNLVYPQVAYARQVLVSGTVPLWNWYTWGGSPLLAAWQSAIFYPPTWLCMAIGLPYGLQLSIFAHLVLAAWGAKRFAENMFGAGSLGSLYAGLVYAGSAFFLGHIEQVNSVATLAWTPWALDALFRTIANRRGYLQLAVAVLMGFLAGHPQHLQLALFFGVVGGASFLLLSRIKPCTHLFLPGRAIWSNACLAGAAVGLGIVASAPQLFPSLELAAWSERVWPFDDPFTPHFRWRHLLAFVVPRFFNKLAGTEGQPVGFTEEGVYCGILSLLLCGVYVCLARRHTLLARSFPIWLLMVVGAFLFSLGPEGGLAPIVCHTIPGFAKLRGSARALNVVVLLLGCGAGTGFSILARRFSDGARFSLFLGAMACTTAELAWTHQPELASLFVSREVLTADKPRFGEVKPSLWSPRRVYRFMAHDSDLYLDHRATAVSERFVRMQPNLNMITGVAVIDGYEEGLLPPWPYGNFLRKFNRNLRNETLDATLLALMGVEYVISEYPAKFDNDRWELKQRWTDRAPMGSVYTLWKTRVPTAWFYDWKTLVTANDVASKGEQHPLRDILSDERTANGQPQRTPPGRLLVEHPLSKYSSSSFALAARQASLRVRAIAPNSLLLEVRDTHSSSTRVIYSGVLCPGWKWCLCKHQLVPVVYSGAFRPFSLVELPPIENRQNLRLCYAPFSYRFGCFSGLAGVLVMVIVALSVRLKRELVQC
ncbi:MAG: hypothetical protein ACP5UB_03520 [Candidatus Sumerlaeaceae bacterium]